jgi:signal transduction histidine kinase
LSRATDSTTWLATVVLVIASIVIVGWVFGPERLTEFGPDLASMKLNTAVCLVALAALQLVPERRLGIFVSYIVIAIAVVTLGEYISGVNLGIDELLVTDSAPAATYPGRMPGVTALALLLLAVADLALRRGLRRLAQGLAGGTLVLGGVVVLGYLYGVNSLHQTGPYSTMAVHTAIALLCLSLAFLARVRDGIVQWIILGEDAGALLQRRLLPFVLLLLPLLALLRLRAERLKLYDAKFGLALNTTVAVGVLTAITVRAALALRRMDSERLEANAALGRLNTELEARVRDRSEELDRERTRVVLLQDRNRIARDLHDRVVQRIYASGLELATVKAAVDDDSARTIADTISELDISIRELRETIFKLELGLAGDTGIALSATAARLERLLGFMPGVTISGDLSRLWPGLAEHLLAVAHESLTNVAKHARASFAWVNLTVADDEVTLVIGDDGCGLPASTRRSGLANIESRAAELGGNAHWEANLPHGTVLRFRAPLEEPGCTTVL